MKSPWIIAILLAGVSSAASPALLAADVATADRAAATPAGECGSENLVGGKLPAQQAELRGDAQVVTDGAVGAEGTDWDLPLAVTLDTRAGPITYDLGRPRTVSAFRLP